MPPAIRGRLLRDQGEAVKDQTIKDAARAVFDATMKVKNSGKLKSFVSIDGHLTLMADKIERFFETRKDSEIINLAVDALLAVILVLPDVDEDEVLEKVEGRLLAQRGRVIPDDE